uniref:putative porin n=1 Tax=Bradyrhizobium sp. (strain ORS 278) TaxID=114615 RepID=UPI0005A21BDE
MGQAELKKQGMAAAAAVIMLAAVGPAVAQDDSAPVRRPSVSRNAAPSANATVNLINLLVKQGVLTDEQATALVKQADDEAYVARQAVSTATSRADDAAKTAAAAANATSPPGTKRVTYVPEIVKKQLRDEIRQEVMAKAEKENWASPGKYPEWAQRLRFYGDVRVRYEGDFFGKNNNPFAATNYNAINSGSPFDVSNFSNPYLYPTYDTDQNRNRARLRARLGLDADLFDGFSAGIRLATGDGSSPVSFNASLGGNGGNFSKYNIWIDRGFVKYKVQDIATLQAGRFDNPFFSPTDLVYHRDLGFDGFAAQIKYPELSNITPFAVGGAFPIFNTDINAGSVYNQLNQIDPTIGKARSEDRWMFGGQLGAISRPLPDTEFTLAAAYYDFTNVQGRLSSSCYVFGTQDFCNTDLKRPLFAQKGNTYMQLRNIRWVPENTFGRDNQFQYFGLASGFRDLVISSRLDLAHFYPIHIILDGEFVQNLAWDRADIAAKVAANPLGTSATAPCVSNSANANTQACFGPYVGGNKGYLGRLTVGHRDLKELWDWNAFVGYKYLESDAVIDAFTDSDFGLGGTNLKGYFIGGNVAIGRNTTIGARWLSANQVAGAPYAVDVFQVDLSARF